MRAAQDARPADVHAAILSRSGHLRVRYGRREMPFAGGAPTAAPFLRAFYATRELFSRFASEDETAVALYGALVLVDGGAVLVLGPTTIGKTLLALCLAHEGAQFLGDETALLSYNGEIRAMPRCPSLREPGLAFLPSELMRRRVLGAPHAFATPRGRLWYALSADDLGGVAPSERPYPLRAVCAIGERAESFAMREIQQTDMFATVAQRAYSRPTELSELAALRRAMRRARHFSVTLGTPQESAAALLHGLRACG